MAIRTIRWMAISRLSVSAMLQTYFRGSRLLLCLLLAGLPGFAARADEGAANQAETQSPGAAAPQASRIGVVLLRDESGQPEQAKRLTQMLASRLAERFEGSEFIVIDPTDKDAGKNVSQRNPLLLDEAVALGQREGVQAVLDGSFGGVEISGGVWPSQTADFPQARGFLRWRVVDCQEGLIVADGEIRPKDFSTYPQRIRTEKELVQRVLGDLCTLVGDALEEAGMAKTATSEDPAVQGGRAEGQ